MRTRTLVFIVGAVIAALAVATLTLALTEVTDRGKDLRPYESGPVYRIEIAETVTAYADAESKPNTDVISGSLLVALATASLFMLLILNRTAGPPRLRRFYLLATAGFAFLAFDEFCALHETLGHNLPFLVDLPGVDRPDDLVFSLFLLPGIAFVYLYRDVFMSSSRLRVLFGSALVAGALAALADLAGAVLDDPLEILSAGLILAGFISLIASHLTAQLPATNDSGVAESAVEPAAALSASRP